MKFDRLGSLGFVAFLRDPVARAGHASQRLRAHFGRRDGHPHHWLCHRDRPSIFFLSPMKNCLHPTRLEIVLKASARWLAALVCSLFGLSMARGQNTRAPAPSLFYASAVTTAEIIEVRVPKGVDGTYYCALQWNTGYMGFQQRGSSGLFRHVHFSVWDPDGGGITSAVFTDAKTRAVRFGGEGTGIATYHDFAWKDDTWYALAIISAAYEGGADYSGYLYDPGTQRWTLVATLRRPRASSSLGYASSFLEDFNATHTVKRSVQFRESWRLNANVWVPMRTALFNVSLGAPGQVIYDGASSSAIWTLTSGGDTTKTIEPLASLSVADGGRPMSMNFRNSSARLLNLSTRSRVTPADPLIGGLVIAGDAPMPILLRGAGPALGSLGVGSPLPNPRLQLYSGNTLLMQNDDWLASTTDAMTSAGAFSFSAGSKDAAMIAILEPGAYTVQITDAGGASGTALVEAYVLP
jgi:Domain of unknown function (DUF3472)